MYTRFLLSVLIAVGCALQARATDLTKIERVIRKEPAYEGKPRYALLVFGKEAKTRIWLVQDGKSLFVDRNGNGDLTEPGERIANDHGNSFNIDQLTERDGTRHQNLFVMSAVNNTFRIRMGQFREHGGQFVGWGAMERPTWGDRPESAPIIHFNGPLTLERYGPIVTIPRGDGHHRGFKLRLMLGTPGLGAGTFASFSDVCSKELGAVHADIEYPDAWGREETLKQCTELVHDG
jgi:hypothetical protein